MEIEAVAQRIAQTTGANSSQYLFGKNAGARWATEVASADDMDRFQNEIVIDAIAQTSNGLRAGELLARVLDLGIYELFGDVRPTKQYVLGFVDGAAAIFSAAAPYVQAASKR